MEVGRPGGVIRDVRDSMCYQSQECYILRRPQGESDAQQRRFSNGILCPWRDVSEAGRLPGALTPQEEAAFPRKSLSKEREWGGLSLGGWGWGIEK